MVRSLALTLAVGAAVLSAGSATANDAVKKAIGGRYKQYEQAYQKRDVPAMMKLTTSDFVVHLPGGRKFTRKQAETELKSQFQMLPAGGSFSVTIRKVELKGAQATVIAAERAKHTLAGPDGKKMPVLIASESRDVWVKKGSQWLLKSSTMLNQKITSNGKPVPIPTPAGG
ncbi:MAG: nuclear transport factor 2 family protein [Armatimonadota bacterium]